MDSATVFSKEQALKFAKQQLEIAKLAKTEVGGQSKEDRKALSDAEKAQRDLIKERIEAYKELQSQYEKYLVLFEGTGFPHTGQNFSSVRFRLW